MKKCNLRSVMNRINRIFDVGTSGEISLILEEHKNVLTLPVDAVHNADGKNYVYVLGGKQYLGNKVDYSGT